MKPNILPTISVVMHLALNKNYSKLKYKILNLLLIYTQKTNCFKLYFKRILPYRKVNT